MIQMPIVMVTFLFHNIIEMVLKSFYTIQPQQIVDLEIMEFLEKEIKSMKVIGIVEPPILIAVKHITIFITQPLFMKELLLE